MDEKSSKNNAEAKKKLQEQQMRVQIEAMKKRFDELRAAMRKV